MVKSYKVEAYVDSLCNYKMSSSLFPKAYGSELIRYTPDKNNRLHETYEITSDEVTYIAKDNEHCNECYNINEVDFDHCFLEHVSSQMNCTLPWKTLNASLETPLCMYPGENKHFMNIVPLIYGLDEETIFKVTGCMPCCTRNEISAKLVSTDIIDKNHQYYYKDVDNYLIMMFYYANNKIRVKEEYYTYDISNLIADFGGFLGLLLGYSILGLYDTTVHTNVEKAQSEMDEVNC